MALVATKVNETEKASVRYICRPIIRDVEAGGLGGTASNFLHKIVCFTFLHSFSE